MPKKTQIEPSSGSARLRSASCQNSSFSSASFSRLLGREVLRLREVVRQVVQLPRVLLGVPLARSERRERRRRELPRRLVEARARPPAVLVDRPRADHLEVLHGVPLRGVRVVERVEEARAVHRLLLDPVDDLRLRDAGRLENGRPDVDAVRELRAQVAAGLDLAGPGDDHRVARPAQMAGHLLAPLERRVAGPGPGGRDVRRRVVVAPGIDAAVLVDQLELLLGLDVDAVQERHLVERARRRPLEAGAVVAPDVEDQRVVEVAHLLDGVEEAADVPVGVVHEAGVDLHLPRVELLRGVVERVPGVEEIGPLGQHCVLRDHAELLLALEDLLADLVPALVELALVLVGPLLRTWCGAWAQPVE